MKQVQDIHFFINGLKTGDIAVLSRAITLIESTNARHQELASALIDEILPLSGNSIRIGVTGVPGVGKSTFIEAFGMHLINLGRKVAVLAIDPSSNITKGSILGDKTRMEKLSAHTNAFIRPTASSGSLGGLAYKTREATLLCEAAGFDVIIIETVGVGQSETEVSHITDFFLLLMLAGAGDELQGIKRGIMEMADALVITKADGQNIQQAKQARTEYARALHFLPPQASGWRPKVLLASSYENTGIENIRKMMEDYFDFHKSEGFFEEKRKQQNMRAFHQLLQEKIQHFIFQREDLRLRIATLKNEVIAGKISPYSAIRLLTFE